MITTLALGVMSVDIKDNEARLHIDARSDDDAEAIARVILERLTLHLTAYTDHLISYHLDRVDNIDTNRYSTPSTVSIHFEMYDLPRLRGALESAAQAWDCTDQILEKAMGYFQHALFLMKATDSIRHRSLSQIFLLSDAFLNLWKAVSTVIGDPSKDSDYQSRYRMIGIAPDFFRDEIEPLRKLRNDYDVAHYMVGRAGLDEVAENFGKASRTAEHVLSAYRHYLVNGGKPLAPGIV